MIYLQLHIRHQFAHCFNQQNIQHFNTFILIIKPFLDKLESNGNKTGLIIGHDIGDMEGKDEMGDSSPVTKPPASDDSQPSEPPKANDEPTENDSWWGSWTSSTWAKTITG